MESEADPARTNGTLERRIAQGLVRGAIAAMAMTGLREFTRQVGLLEEPPPEAIIRQKLLGRLRGVKSGPRRAQVELAHWSFGAAAGACYAALPGMLRRGRWSGPLFGLLVWSSFEMGIAPLMRLSQARRHRPLDRLALAGDHLFYGFLLSENATLRAPAGEPADGEDAPA